jgi:hypothetical protein
LYSRLQPMEAGAESGSQPGHTCAKAPAGVPTAATFAVVAPVGAAVVRRRLDGVTNCSVFCPAVRFPAFVMPVTVTLYCGAGEVQRRGGRQQQ